MIRSSTYDEAQPGASFLGTEHTLSPKPNELRRLLYVCPPKGGRAPRDSRLSREEAVCGLRLRCPSPDESGLGAHTQRGFSWFGYAHPHVTSGGFSGLPQRVAPMWRLYALTVELVN